MKTPSRFVVLSLLAAVALPAQSGEQKGAKSQKPEKIVDSKVTKKDPAIVAIDKFIKKQSVSHNKRGWRQTLKAPPKVEFQKDKDYLWHVETSEGALTIRYLTESAPVHVTSGIYLSRLGYYDGLNFHRIIPGFMAQGGCPTGTGTGGPGYFIDGEFPANMRKHDKPGLLSMANTGRPKSDGSQFFLTFVPTPHLNGKHTVWGEVVEGMDTVKKLAKKGTRSNNGMLGRKGPAMVRTWVEVVEKKKAEAADGEGDGQKGGAQKEGGQKEGGQKEGGQ